MKLILGQRYRAKITGVPFFMGASGIESRIADAGFRGVTVWKKDGQWMAEGVWSGATQDVALPDHISEAWPV